MTQRTAIIIGAGPAGLTAALELLRRSGKTPEGAPAIRPIVLEADDSIGGISRTVRYKGNRMDIGGHRFFSKSRPRDALVARAHAHRRRRRRPRRHLLSEPASLAARAAPAHAAGSRSRARHAGAPAPQSRIYFLRRFFDYPITLSRRHAAATSGLARTAQDRRQLPASALLPSRKPEKSLEHFFINRFGRELYLTFFKSYTEKVWGVPCDEISAEWGAQRIKGLSLTKRHRALPQADLQPRTRGSDLAQKDTETSLIEQFLYPKLGPGQLWEQVADRVTRAGRRDPHRTGASTSIETDGAHRVVAVEARDARPASAAASPATTSSPPCRSRSSSRARLDQPCSRQRARGRRRPACIATSSPSACCVDRLARHASADGAAAQRQLDLHPGARRARRPAADLQQLEPVPGRRPVQGLARPRVLLLRDRRALDACPMRRSCRFATAGAGKDRHHRRRRRARRPRGPHAQDLPGLLRHLRSLRRDPRLRSTASRICSWSAATACTSTTIRTTRC